MHVDLSRRLAIQSVLGGSGFGAGAHLPRGLSQLAGPRHLLRHHVAPTATNNRGLLAAGALLTYLQNIEANYRQVATFIDHILRGTKPGEMPFEQPTKLDLTLNLRAAKALGLRWLLGAAGASCLATAQRALTMPQSILLRAARVIE